MGQNSETAVLNLVPHFELDADHLCSLSSFSFSITNQLHTYLVTHRLSPTFNLLVGLLLPTKG